MSRFWARLKHNWPAKLLSLLAAFLLWYQLKSTEPIVDRVVKRPLEVLGLDPDRVAVGLPQTVVVRVRAEARLAEGLHPEAIVAYLDLSSVKEGPFDRPVEVRVPAGFQVAAVIPARVIGFVDRYAKGKLPLLGFAPKKAVVPDRKEIEVRGPAKTLQAAAYVLGIGEKTLTLSAFDAQGHPLPSLTPKTGAAARFVGPLLSQRRVPLALPGPPPGLAVRQLKAPREVTLVGPPETLAELRFVVGEVEWRAGAYTAPIRLKLPPGVYVLNPPWGQFVVETVK